MNVSASSSPTGHHSEWLITARAMSSADVIIWIFRAKRLVLHVTHESLFRSCDEEMFAGEPQFSSCTYVNRWSERLQKRDGTSICRRRCPAGNGNAIWKSGCLSFLKVHTMPSGPLPEALIKKLRVSNDLNDEDIRALESLPIAGKSYAPQQRIVVEGDRPTECCLIIDGYAYRSKTTGAGLRQVLSIHVAGEIPDLQSLHLHVMDHDLTALTGCTLGFIPHEYILDLCARHPGTAAALWRETLVDAAIFREWMINIGRRTATERMAHLLMELWERLEPIGRTHEDSFELPVTQSDLADCLGLTPVHINRVLRQLRNEKLLEIVRREFKLLDRPKLKELGQFDPTYLHLHPSM
ncbi:Crp/Fnr family transcriptional regulator [Bradyrhizobium sp. LHD-71]|uniref:Crp/Fnr family transcriptional regulator n=1 Tax=Bradyrhizobium sp. LHD-71 TaxID=3072141 RepID=UPI00280E6487|nr:Crp/Fnr family transcriptional regulator [Bradyrhizobium sp. LHD-71]MDQ8729180.1 Crp/Fnr family transcriptional regulator [Bradyrhizobium sp. LHD-71]